MEFDNQVVAIAGASGNLGMSVARAFESAGAGLALIDRSMDNLARYYPDYLEASGKHLLINCADMSDPETVGRAMGRIHDSLGRIDVFVSVVGGFRSGTPLHETSLETFDFLMTVNARTFFNASKAVVPYMLAQKSGRIIGVGGRPGLKGVGNMAAYSAAKSALLRLVESMAAELVDEGITVNCVMPGTIDTPQNREALPRADYSRWVQPESLADVIVFLASRAARDISGAAIPVYGRS